MQYSLKKAAFLDKSLRSEANKKMRGWLTAISDMQAKYIDGQDFRRNNCYDQEKIVAPPKLPKFDQNDEKVSDEKQEKLRLYWKKVRKFQNSFGCADNLIMLEADDTDLFNKFPGTAL